MTFCSTSVANTIFDLNKCALDFLLVLLSINGLLEWRSGLCGLLDRSSSSTGLDRSDQSGPTGLTGLVLMALKSEIKPSTPASFHNFQVPKVVIGLNANHFHKFW